MGDINQLDYIQTYREEFQSPILEVGLHDYGATQNLRSLFGNEDYVGIDMNGGAGVDLVLDLTQSFK